MTESFVPGEVQIRWEVQNDKSIQVRAAHFDTEPYTDAHRVAVVSIRQEGLGLHRSRRSSTRVRRRRAHQLERYGQSGRVPSFSVVRSCCDADQSTGERDQAALLAQEVG